MECVVIHTLPEHQRLTPCSALKPLHPYCVSAINHQQGSCSRTGPAYTPAWQQRACRFPPARNGNALAAPQAPHQCPPGMHLRCSSQRRCSQRRALAINRDFQSLAATPAWSMLLFTHFLNISAYQHAACPKLCALTGWLWYIISNAVAGPTGCAWGFAGRQGACRFQSAETGNALAAPRAARWHPPSI